MGQTTVIATWPFGKIAVDKAAPMLAGGTAALDAAVAGAEAVENDPRTHSVGFAGLADRIGRVSLDSCVMDGKTLDCGAVACLTDMRRPAALARKVYQKTPHVLIVGDGAKWFGLQQGFPLETLSTAESVAIWEKQKAAREKPPADKPAAGGEDNHDTVTVLARDTDGDLGGVCTTSGLAFKYPGRVGDSPLIGSGLYVDNEAGAAGATGVGEEIIRVGGSFLVVELMRDGKTPQEACEAVVKRVIANSLRRGKHPARVAFLALSPKGEIGAACTAGTNFRFAVGVDKAVEMRQGKELSPPQE